MSGGARAAAPALGPLNERQLAHLWEGQRFPPAALTTRDGQPLTVLYRGRAPGGPGPDFRDALIAAPWGVLAGDVELHVRTSDFRRHGHGRDPAYDRLALHIVFWDDEGEDTLLASGRRVSVAALAPWAERRRQEIRRWLERPPLWQEPCRSALARLGADSVAGALDELGHQRFREKTEAIRLRFSSEPAEELLWRGLLEALGYGGERQPFRELALRLPWRRLSLGLRRLPPRQRPQEAARLLLAAWEQAGRPPRPCRPGNEPERRLLGAARLASRYCEEGLAASLLRAVGAGAGSGAALIAALTVAEGPRASIGRSRALEIAANVVLPFAAAGDDPALARQAEALYARLPQPARYGAVRHLHMAAGSQVAPSMRRQQGMLYLLQRFCSRGGCGRCPLS